MFKKYSSLLLIVLLIVWGCNPRPDNTYPYKVVKIKDGDTIGLLSSDNQEMTVRLAEVDCPEKTQAYGQAAKKFTSDLCFGKYVKLIGNVHDRYGRTVALVILDDGTNVNYQLVKSGYAWQYKQYSKNAELAGYEQQARENKLGLWADANPTPPWDFRREKKPAYRAPKTDSLQTKPRKKHYRKRKPKLEEAH
ncbi:Endonuclease YncB, thermonuclease family [Mucilaginibacter pineti]|uniref:Endonuclease YncB, thermonuclease family n=1 Tax=Mucilaginibacter pineti TaxID=1391627 RepID=A0A1G7BKU7_9SPHI|nr:thermonuclease family protein [Mucilaginibacter pineti]SDE27731.1 Endonuclease YncB, thermonuclease family [Mucilaginibacter pineti]